MLRALPDFGDPLRLAAMGKSYAGTLALSDCKRLSDSLASLRGEANYQIAFRPGEGRRPKVRGLVQANLPLRCQRCLGVFDLPVQRRWEVTLIEDSAEEKLLPEGENAFLVSQGRMKLSDFIEDELILALPLVPRHPRGASCRMPVPAEAAEPKRAGQANPFAALEAIRKKH